MAKVAPALIVMSYTFASLVSVGALGVPAGIVTEAKRSGMTPPDQLAASYQLVFDAPIHDLDTPGPLMVIMFEV